MRTAHACSLIQVESPGQLVPTSQIILIGEVVSADAAALVLRPEAFLKGPASAEDIRLAADTSSGCPMANLAAGQRALIYIGDAARPSYPLINQAYLLQDGHAVMEGGETLTEVEAVAEIRAITGQYVVPAATEAEGAGIDWASTILPLGAALLIIFGIGLVLMRIWHRIDPS